MQHKTFKLSLTPAAYQEYYRGEKHSIVTLTEDGRRLQFPANLLRQFVTHEGVHGRFEITFTDENKLVGLSKIT